MRCITRAPTLWLCGLNVFRIGNQGKITFEWAALWSWTSPHLIHKDTDAPLVRIIETSRYLFFSFTIKKKIENRKRWIPLLWFQFQCFWWTFCYLKGTERIRWWGGWGPNKILTIVTILFLILIILITDVKWQNQWWALVASVSLLLIPHTICHSLLTLQSLWWHYKCSAYAVTHLARSVL